MGVDSKDSKNHPDQVEAKPAPPPAYTPWATDSVDQPAQQESARSMPQQAEYMQQNCAQPVQYQHQPSYPPPQWNGPAQYTPPNTYQDRYQNKYQNQYQSGQYQRYQDQYQNGQYQKYQDQYQDSQYQKYQDQYHNGQYQKYQDQYENGQYQQYQQKYQDFPYQQYIPPARPQQQSQYYPQPQPPLQRPPIQGLKPCVIPQITKVFGGSYMSPFVRVRVPELEQQIPLSPSELLAFIDGLNEAFLGNPALQATNTVGTIIGLVPLGTAQMVGLGLNVGAGLATAGVSIARTKSYMKTANETIFKPKGLHVQIRKTDKMLSQIGMPNDSAVFARHQYRGLMDAQTPDENPIAQRMSVLGDRVMRLSFENVNAPVSPDNWVKKVGAFSAQRAEQKQLRKLGKKQAKMDKKCCKSDRKMGKIERKQEEIEDEIDDLKGEIDDIMVQIQSLGPAQRGNEKMRRELKKDLRDLKKDLRDAEEKYEDLVEKVDKRDRRDEKHGRRQVKEAQKVNKMLWIVILPDVGSYAGDDDWDSESDDSRSMRKE
ncbi:hypothetical protein N7486_005529 [Penicillium sp. IBT 16267x]|nr:hypothetical protein N7486_005529 [Penicillium sp. IBT 16267x]